MELKEFLDALAASPETVEFETTMAAIEANYALRDPLIISPKRNHV
ncbi:hypothetical protein ACOMICROBIO_NCLOACGD_04453 [Vibrio sp. B1ASS3]|nr:hypothetical protein ACOMICROBIO_NCLOACGD_04453 [Vibrio sp. B1ASS3]CAE6952728.1 hypothetical protein ACOMICROBIO_NCLOACGD_04453 [Vibrio sp. B1ASS3]